MKSDEVFISSTLMNVLPGWKGCDVLLNLDRQPIPVTLKHMKEISCGCEEVTINKVVIGNFESVP